MLYITNLSPRVDEKRLRDLFSEDGEIIDLILQPNESTGELEAYLEFATAVSLGPLFVVGRREAHMIF